VVASEESAERARAVERGDLDELIRLVDGCCAARDWEGLADLRRRARVAHERTGRQLWPVAAHAEYRLALEAPGRWAGPVLEEGTGRFAPGPLSEVAASSHAWDELSPHVPAGPVAALTAHERVVRGEDLSAHALPGPPVLEVPLRLEPWEPAYLLAEYRAHEAHFPGPPPAGGLTPVDVADGGPEAVRRQGDDVDALLDVAGAWTTGSGGHADAVAVDGDALTALAALGVAGARVSPLAPPDALSLVAWASASGGAHGRRRGAAPGRFTAWWVVAALGGLLADWPVEPDAVGAAAARLRWFAWDRGEPATGWIVRVAVDDPAAGHAWALEARDPASPAP
jgi:hypothetical protein